MKRETIFNWGRKEGRRQERAMSISLMFQRNHSDPENNTPPAELRGSRERVSRGIFPLGQRRITWENLNQIVATAYDEPRNSQLTLDPDMILQEVS